MEYKTSPTGKPADYYTVGLVLAGGVFWSLTNFDKAPAALYQLMALSFFAAAMYILIRYRLTVFRLRIEGKNDAAVSIAAQSPCELDFVAERMRGKGTVTLARLSLEQLKRAEIVPYAKLKELTDSASLYRYQADMSPQKGCLLVFENEDRDVAIFTDLPPEMFNYLKKCADLNMI